MESAASFGSTVAVCANYLRKLATDFVCCSPTNRKDKTMKTVHKWLASILSFATLILSVPCSADDYKPNDNTVQNMTMKDAVDVLIGNVRMLHEVYLNGQWHGITKRYIDKNGRLIITTKQGEIITFTLSKIPQISGGAGLSGGHIELAGQPTFKTDYFDSGSSTDALYVLKQYMVQAEKNTDENIIFWGKAYRGEIGRIGIQFKTQEDMPIVGAVDEGLPASGAGIKVGDRITKVDEIFTKGLKQNEVASLTRGAPDTKLTVSIMHSGSDKVEEISLTRVAMKLALSEEARKYKVQAEGAVRDKKFKDAADLYKEALDVAPWWPEGHFNRALVLGETGDYEMAMREMKRYLQIVPDAPNARAAQDKIYDWERLDSENKIYEWERRVVKDR